MDSWLEIWLDFMKLFHAVGIYQEECCLRWWNIFLIVWWRTGGPDRCNLEGIIDEWQQREGRKEFSLVCQFFVNTSRAEVESLQITLLSLRGLLQNDSFRNQSRKNLINLLNFAQLIVNHRKCGLEIKNNHFWFLFLIRWGWFFLIQFTFLVSVVISLISLLRDLNYML